MNIFIMAILILINFVFSTSIAPYIGIKSIIPNTSILLLVSICILKGKPYGGILGLIIGLLQDIVFGTAIGVNALIYFLIGYGLTNIDMRVSRDNIYIPVIISLVCITIYNFLYVIIMYFAGVNLSILYYIKNVLLIELIYSGALMIPIYKVLSRIYKAPDIRFVRD